MARVVLFIKLVFLLLFPDIFCQSHLSFNHLGVENGLSQSAITCIFQDSKGFMWFGTQDGLNRYDGYNFKIFKNDPDDTTSLSDNFIFSIYEDESN
jgi:ligand-binding sensor domain-containing protein